MYDIPESLNLATHYLDRNLELGRGEKTAISYKDEKFSYSQIISMSNQVGNVLKDLGVEVEDRVLLAINDSPEFVISWYGIVKIGAVATDVYTFLHPKDYEYFLNYTRAKVAIVDETTLPLIQGAVKKSKYLKHLLVIGKTAPGQLNFYNLINSASKNLEVAETNADDVAIWKFTSGSTGKPKAVPLTHRNSFFNYLTFARQVLCLEEDDIILSVPKLFFGYARDISILYGFAAGASVVLIPERSRPRRIVDNIKKHSATVLVNVPTMINSMLRLPDVSKNDFSTLKFCTSAGEALPKELYDQWMEKFGIEVLDGIGSCELCHIYLSNRKNNVRPGSLGQLVPGYEAMIVDDKGQKLPEGQDGILWVKGDSRGLCYWQAFHKTQETFRGEWVNTGDLFRCDSDGYYWFVGRGSDVLKVGGIFVAPLQIENCLLSHNLVKEAAVIGVSDEQGLIIPKAFVVVSPGVETSLELAKELQQYVKDNLAPYKYPRKLEFISELPTDNVGKVSKKLLKKYEEK
ncbi:MAG: benzoate-CoA ligase family protein [Desulfobacula sp.]|jgi:benzoate-CoA ligase family protein|uniref:benzoate-CoA ligase family protein n=1 Tax=Desulfobacula sp. TaxID=2593537 RepID=UPI001DC9028D|nr:benzoate-CoA ligase family protein [Desulfobacula sp.]MBT4024276.1 benzoate-CoA ligase family protein [Desulfobacula sp.]MBT4873785.1 benzoate-CoA ligase family protein [Desulfobacula sp.]MBT5543435.1 benzoate-CoA ligase family protein [Desulfobacula sp.]MBT5973008.1 benzoate-CoA ligase family protein [Desulfobacula sp.]